MPNEISKCDSALHGRDELHAQIEEYDAIYADYLSFHKKQGIAFSSFGKNDVERDGLLQRLREKGVLFRNGGSSISVNSLSSACVACTGCSGSKTFFISLRCLRNCYFCFNPNQENYQYYLSHDRDWRGEFDEARLAGSPMTHIALTGGEPLLCLDETLAFLREAHSLWPDAHLRLYTTGDGLTEEALQELVACGLSEIRFSIKLDDCREMYVRTLATMRMAQKSNIDVMVEMPVVPGTLSEMKQLLIELNEMEIFGINLLEFCFPLNNWAEFSARGFKVKNPPFSVLYDYGYAGSLPIEDSEIESLRLIEFAADEGLDLSVHYCSLNNKHCDQVISQNNLGDPGPEYQLDCESHFYKTCKTFGEGALLARDLLKQERQSLWMFDSQDGSLAMHPSLLPLLADSDIATATSYNILEQRNGSLVLRELALKEN